VIFNYYPNLLKREDNMQINLHYHNLKHSPELDSFIKNEISSLPFINKNYFNSVSCYLNDDSNHHNKCVKVKMIVHCKNHEDFVCECVAADPYSPWSDLMKKTKKHFDKIFK